MKLMEIFIILIINIIESYEWSSPCENTTDPTGYESCKKRNTEYIYEACCYMEATQNGEYEPECVEVSRDDVRNKGDVEKTRQKILEGKYWVNNNDAYDSIDKLICSSDYMFLSIYLLFLIFLLKLLKTKTFISLYFFTD